MPSSQEIFSRNLYRLRKQRMQQEEGWSQEDLANRVGVHRNYVGLLERGERTPSLDVVDGFAAVLGVPPHELLKPAGQGEG